MNQRIKTLLVDDHGLFRETLTHFLKNNQKIEIIGQACNGREAIDKLKVFADQRIEVDIVLLDAEMPVMDGLTTLEICVKRFPSIKVVILTEQKAEIRSSEFISNGARSIVSKNSGSLHLIESVERVFLEGFFFDPPSSKAMRDALIRNNSHSLAGEDRAFKPIEIVILKNVCKGKTNKQIALSLNMSPSGIDFYKGKIYSKAACNNSAGLIKFALKNDLISVAEL